LLLTNRQARNLAMLLLKVAELSDREEDIVDRANKAEPPARISRATAPALRASPLRCAGPGLPPPFRHGLCCRTARRGKMAILVRLYEVRSPKLEWQLHFGC
jgi:hypothetical protein